MFMPIFALKKLHVQGLAESTLGDEARAVGAEHHIEIAADPEPDRNSFIRTDQYSFVQAGVPALAMKFGWTANSPEYKACSGRNISSRVSSVASKSDVHFQIDV
jgi:hypothetical protein